MAFHMMHAKGGYAEAHSQRSANGCTNQQGADEPRTGRVSKPIQILQTAVSFFQYIPDQRKCFPNMIPGGKFRDYTPVLLV